MINSFFFKNIRFVSSVLFMVIVLALSATAQVNQSLSSVSVDNLSDIQVRQIQTQIRAAGVPDSQIEQEAVNRGMNPAEAKKLVQRLNVLKDTTPRQDSLTSRQQNNPAKPVPVTDAGRTPVNTKPKIFGSDLFNNPAVTFEPNLRIATPKNYIIGPDDEIKIDITGDNEANYTLKVSPEGTIRVEYAGIIQVNGLTVEEATRRIRSKLTGTYPGVKAGRTTVTVSIGNIRSIRVTIVGEVTRPATYTISSLSSVFNALYQAGGPSTNGSFREIQIIRNNRPIATLDAYDWLLKGYQTKNIRLEDQDVIRIPVYKAHVTVKGEVKHPAIFEVLPSEKFSDVLDFAGGFSDKAYTAFVKVIRNTNRDRESADVPNADFQNFVPRNGDMFQVDTILTRLENRVTIKGAVFRQGQFTLNPGLTLSGLITKAEGLTEDASLNRGVILRLQADNTLSAVAFDVGAIMNKTIPDILLKREDVITIPSQFDLRDEYKVTINGEVRKGKTVNYAKGMTLQDLILLAGGFTEGASTKTIEVARRIKNNDVFSPDGKIAEIFNVTSTQNLSVQDQNFPLEPFDIVTVRNNVGYYNQLKVSIEGEVLHPGPFVLAEKEERISTLIKRAGGLTPNAYPEGASLKRNGNAVGSDKNKLDYTDDNLLKEKNSQRLQAGLEDSVSTERELLQVEVNKNNSIGIDLVKILKNPGQDDDLALKEGDILRIPQKLQTVKINGEVLYPVTAVYKDNQGFSEYISQGGGFTQKAIRGKSYVVYANGSVSATHHFLFLKNYPKIKPGSEIFVPQRAEKKGISTAELVAISTGLASIGGIIIGILNLSK